MADIRQFCAQDLVKDIINWQEWLKNVKCFSAKTCDAYLSDIKIFFRFLFEYHNNSVKRDDLVRLEIDALRGFLANRAEQDISAVSRSRELSAIKSLLNYIAEESGQEIKAVVKISYPKLKKYLPKALNYDDMLNIVEMLKPNNKDWQEQRDYLIILLIYTTGLRISEVVSIQANMISSEAIKVVGKGSKERYVPILEDVYNELQKYLKILPYSVASSEVIFRGSRGGPLSPRIIQRKLKAVREELCLPEYTTPHAIRHSFATHLLDGGANIREIQELLGHENISTTERYTKVMKENLLKKYKNFHPRG